jgi:hypothetical protein
MRLFAENKHAFGEIFLSPGGSAVTSPSRSPQSTLRHLTLRRSRSALGSLEKAKAAHVCAHQSSKQRRVAVGELQIWPRFAAPEPADRNGALDPGAKFFAAGARCQKWCVQLLDEDATILYCFNAIRDLDQLACGGIQGRRKAGVRRTSCAFSRHHVRRVEVLLGPGEQVSSWEAGSRRRVRAGMTLL